MVLLISLDPAPTYDVIDDGGQVIGQVLGPETPRVTGLGEGTVLLRRPVRSVEQRRPQHAA